jgi:uncharacterized metal-binding protein
MVRPMPVLFACQGCAQFGDIAHEVAALLDTGGYAEATWLGAPGRDEQQFAAKARSRFPVFAIDGCARRCACQWLGARGVKVQRQFILASPGDTAESIAERIGERLANGC